MTDETIAYSRPVGVVNLRPDGLEISLQPDEAERAAIARALDIPSIDTLRGTFRLTPRKAGAVHVGGEVRASVHQICVVSLDAFPVPITEEVDVDFAPEMDASAKSTSAKSTSAKSTSAKAASAKSASARMPVLPTRIPQGATGHDLEEVDPPDPIIDGKIDLGALLVEFVALGLDPFPRKPGVVFDFKDEADVIEHPMAALARLKRDE